MPQVLVRTAARSCLDPHGRSTNKESGRAWTLEVRLCARDLHRNLPATSGRQDASGRRARCLLGGAELSIATSIAIRATSASSRFCFPDRRKKTSLVHCEMARGTNPRWRSLNESGLWNADAIERQLAHVDNDSVRRAYARADF